MMSVAVLVSCSKIESDETSSQTGIALTLRMSGVETKAAMSGVAELNENKIKTVNCYIFNGDELLYSGSQNPGKEVTGAGIRINLPFTEEKFAEVFAEANTDLRVYVVANAASALEGKTISSPADLGAVAVEIAGTGKQDSFVMTGDAVIAEDKTGNSNDVRKATAEVSLKRLISKVSLTIKLAEKYQKDASSPVWTPATNAVKVTFHNLEKKGLLSGTPVNADYANAPEATFTAGALDGGFYPCTSSEPYYTYPRTWAFGDDNQPYFLVEIPWTSNATPAVTATSYYKVILSNKSFESNDWYVVNVTLSGLGSATIGKPVVITDGEVTVADWKDAVPGEGGYSTGASFTDSRVLDIPQENALLYNQNTASFSFLSTHDCVIKSVVLKQIDYSKSTVEEINTPMAASDYPFTIDNTAKTINFSHNLINDITASDFDYKDYTYVLTICHSDKQEYEDVLTVVQRPSLTIVSEQNSAGKTTNWNTWVNGKHDNSTYGGLINQLPSSTSGTDSNSNPNMYIISASVLSGFSVNGTSVQIGDPRSSTPESWTGSASLSAVDGTTRKLLYYYKTDESKSNVIAPKFRIASSWGRCSNTLSKTNAVYRCSSYQEDGYPAGRWRIPTEAEVLFMITLSGKGYINSLFSETIAYWCNSCILTPKSGAQVDRSTPTTNSSARVRCVYDEWYWEESKYAKVDKDTPTWGDMARENFE